MERRSFIRQTGIAGVLAAGAAPAIVHAQANIRWRLASSFPKSLDTIYGGGDVFAKKVGETLLPRLSNLPGFNSYYLIEAGNGVMSSIGFFDTSEQADESTRVASNWVREQKLETALPNPPKIPRGEVVAHKTRELVPA